MSLPSSYSMGISNVFITGGGQRGRHYLAAAFF
jgi:hypothetical protein